MNQQTQLPWLVELNDTIEWLMIKGTKLFDLFQGQLTIDMNTVTQTHSRLAALCTPQGKVVASFRILPYQDGYLLRLPKGMASVTKQWLDRYAPLYQARIEPLSWQGLGVVGRIDANIGSQRPSWPESSGEWVITHDGLVIVSIQQDRPRYEIYGAPALIDNLRQTLQPLTQKKTSDEWKCLDIAANIAPVYPETSQQLTPHRLGYQHIGLIDFQKGCYTGQEIIARTHYKSQRIFQLVHKTSTEPIAPGKPLHDDQTKRMVLECALDAEQKAWQILAT